MLYASRPRVFCSFVQISAGPFPATPPLSESSIAINHSLTTWYHLKFRSTKIIIVVNDSWLRLLLSKSDTYMQL